MKTIVLVVASVVLTVISAVGYVLYNYLVNGSWLP